MAKPMRSGPKRPIVSNPRLDGTDHPTTAASPAAAGPGSPGIGGAGGIGGPGGSGAPARSGGAGVQAPAGPVPLAPRLPAPGPPPGPAGPPRPRTAPVPRTGRRRKVQARRVRRVVRRIDVWTVLKLSFFFWLCVCLILLIAGVILWNIASAFDVINNVEKFIRSLFDLQTFTLRPKIILEAFAAGGGILVIMGTAANVLAAVLYNLMSDVIGGVQVIVLEDQVDA